MCVSLRVCVLGAVGGRVGMADLVLQAAIVAAVFCDLHAD